MGAAWENRVDRLCHHLCELARSVESSYRFGIENADQDAWCEACAPEDAKVLTDAQDGQCHWRECGKILDPLFTDWELKEEIAANVKASARS